MLVGVFKIAYIHAETGKVTQYPLSQRLMGFTGWECIEKKQTTIFCIGNSLAFWDHSIGNDILDIGNPHNDNNAILGLRFKRNSYDYMTWNKEELKVWNLVKGMKCLHTMNFKQHQIRDVDFVNDNKFFMVMTEQQIKIIYTRNYRVIYQFATNSKVQSL